MSEASVERDPSALAEVLSEGYQKIFYQNWPAWFGGVLIGIMSVITFAWARPWGVVGGLRSWADWFFHVVGIYHYKPISPLLSSSSILTIGLLWGSFGSALMSKEFAIRPAPPLELGKGIVGGTLMGIGSAMAGGCTVGGFYSALSALSFSGLAMMVGLAAGAYLALRYLYWELEHLPSKSGGVKPAEGEKKGFNWVSVQPFMGFAVMIFAVICSWLYSRQALTSIGGLLLCGIAFGLIIQRTRFCFVRGFRDPFMTGEGTLTKAIAVSLMISILGFAALKWTGLRPEMDYVPQAFWFGGLVGGIIFGFGMVIAGGCGSGSVWRAGEGQVKLMLAVVCFAMANSLVKAGIRGSKGLTNLMGYRIFLPDYISYKWTIIGLIGFLFIYYVLAAWNEKTDKFTVPM